MSSNIPIEIIMKIFTLATRTRGSAASWITFSKWTYGWFERVLYGKVVLCDEEEAVRFLQCLRLREMHEVFAKTSVNAMYLDGDIQSVTAIEILSLCKGIRNLALALHGDDLPDLSCLQPVLDALPLTVLHMHIGVTLTGASITNTILFSRLTHLDIDNLDLLKDVCLECFPCLTHLALWGAHYGTPEGTVVSLITRLLDHPPLKVLVLRVDNHQIFAGFLDKHSLHDNRIVIAPQRLFIWDDLGRGSMLFWEIAQQKANITKPNHHKHRCIPPSEIINGKMLYMNRNPVLKRRVNYRTQQCYVVGPGIEGREIGLSRVREHYGSGDEDDEVDYDESDDSDDEEEEEELSTSRGESEHGPDE